MLETDRQIVADTYSEYDNGQRTFVLMCDFPSRDDYIHYEKGW